MANRGLKLDHGVSLVVLVLGACLASLAQVNIMAHGTLVSNATDVVRSASRGARTDGAITVNASVDSLLLESLGDRRKLQRLIDGHEAVLGVVLASGRHTLLTIVPIRAFEALVTDTSNELKQGQYNMRMISKPIQTDLVTAVTQGIVWLVPARAQLGGDVLRHGGACNGKLEGMAWVMSMSISTEASPAQVEIIAGLAVKEFGLGVLYSTVSILRYPTVGWGSSNLTCHTRIAGSHAHVQLGHGLLQAGKSKLCLNSRPRWFLNLLLLRLRCDCLSGACDDLAVLGCSLNEPVVTAVAGDSHVNTRLAKVEITVFTGRTVIVNIRGRLVAAVAADGELGTFDRCNLWKIGLPDLLCLLNNRLGGRHSRGGEGLL